MTLGVSILAVPFLLCLWSVATSPKEPGAMNARELVVLVPMVLMFALGVFVGRNK